VIIVDTTVLVYAVGEDHELADPSRVLVEAVGDGRLPATTTAEVIQEFVHVRSRRRARSDAVRIGRYYTELFSPLLAVERRALEHGLALFERAAELGAFDAVLAAAALESEATGLVSADRAFASVPRLTFLELGSPQLDELIEEA
jgi:predicted nucleic acid-binding protein